MRGSPAATSGSEPSELLWRAVQRSTAAAHAAVERYASFLDPAAADPAGALADYLVALHGFWAASEELLLARDDLAAVVPDVAGRLAKARLLSADIEDLRPGVKPIGASLTGPPTQAQALGWVYVLEGATLGGRHIRKALSARVPGLHVRFFDAYGESTAQRWRELRDGIGRWWTAHAVEARALVTDDLSAGATGAFAALRAWLDERLARPAQASVSALGSRPLSDANRSNRFAVG